MQGLLSWLQSLSCVLDHRTIYSSCPPYIYNTYHGTMEACLIGSSELKVKVEFMTAVVTQWGWNGRETRTRLVHMVCQRKARHQHSLLVSPQWHYRVLAAVQMSWLPKVEVLFHHSGCAINWGRLLGWVLHWPHHWIKHLMIDLIIWAGGHCSSQSSNAKWLHYRKAINHKKSWFPFLIPTWPAEGIASCIADMTSSLWSSFGSEALST